LEAALGGGRHAEKRLSAGQAKATLFAWLLFLVGIAIYLVR
jgi:hypothetical protein